jgi:hypothetical protein
MSHGSTTSVGPIVHSQNDRCTNTEHGWTDTELGKSNYPKKTPSHYQSTHHKFYLVYPRSQPGLLRRPSTCLEGLTETLNGLKIAGVPTEIRSVPIHIQSDTATLILSLLFFFLVYVILGARFCVRTLKILVCQ